MMDTVLSNSTLFPRPLLPVRTVTSTITLNSTTTYFFKKLQRRRVVRFRKNPCADTVVVAVGNNKSSTIIRCGGGIREIKEKEFSDAVLKSDRLVLVEFVANWCGPCRLISPAIESIAQEYGDRLRVVKIDHDTNPGLIEEYKVYGLPTLILFKNGEEVPESRREGAITKVKLKEYVDALLESVSVA
ncbi:hypothetical protein RGQ29_015035 [Quercus rubra]|uniref:Thioredoxin domain-containing protein n=1 Tax=Quercus rubra TaxID=3512 RepID=A0AAN7FUR8_QUERU|nr:hypothetical protein RGQ29_015035 [Quercus rubra]